MPIVYFGYPGINEPEQPTSLAPQWGPADGEDLAQELQKIYDIEMNIRIGWFWGGGITLRLGDEMNGYLAEETVQSVADILPCLQEAIAHFFPTSTYARSLPGEVKDRATHRVFRGPGTGASATCPHCGALHVAPLMDELFAFVCSHCGKSVKVQPTKVQ